LIFEKFSGGIAPRPPCWGGVTAPLPRPHPPRRSGASRLGPSTPLIIPPHQQFLDPPLLHEAPESTMKKLQRAQNNAARVVLAVNRRSDAKPLLRQLHWLPVRQCVMHKMAVLMRKTRTTGVPAYLNEHLVPHVAVHHTRSASLPLLTVPKLTTDFSRRSFSYSAPVIWNSLPSNILLCNSDSVFRKHLKTFVLCRLIDLRPAPL